MARQFSDDERERMTRGGAWLRRERQKHGFEHGTELAEALGIKQVRLSAYERGLYPVPEDIARRIAAVLKMNEVDVFRNLGLAMPSDAALKAWARREWPDVIADVLGDDPGPNPPNPGRSGTTRPPSGDSRTEDDEGEENAV